MGQLEAGQERAYAASSELSSGAVTGTMTGGARDQLRLAELLAALSLAADLGNGVPMETTLRVCLLAGRLAAAADFPDADREATYYTGLLWSAGCTSTAHEETVRFGDDIGLKRAMAGTDFEHPADILRHAAAIGQEWGALARLRGLGGIARYGRAHGEDVAAFHCEAASRLARRLGLSAGVQMGLGAFFEYWNGKGGPARLAGSAIPRGARAARLAYEVVYALRLHRDPVAVVESRAGGELDPNLVAVFVRNSGDLISGLAEESIWQEALDLEPMPRPWAALRRLDEFAGAFGDFVDLKSVYWLGHSSSVAAIARSAAGALRLDSADQQAIRSAALFHGIGRVAVSNRIWDRQGPLSTAEWERVRLYPYFTDRVLSRSPSLADVARVASGAQERLDAAGYHRGLPAAAQAVGVRVLAAAAAYQSMIEERPHRGALTREHAAAQLRGEASAGRLDTQAVGAVLEAAGHQRRRSEWPAGLTDREVEVLRLVARGSTNREVATSLVISPETARNHVRHIYDKIGVSTRAGAALFAMEHGVFAAER